MVGWMDGRREGGEGALELLQAGDRRYGPGAWQRDEGQRYMSRSYSQMDHCWYCENESHRQRKGG